MFRLIRPIIAAALIALAMLPSLSQPAAAQDAQTLQYGDSVADSLGADERHTYYFEGEAGQIIVIDVDIPSESELAPRLALLSPGEQSLQVASSDYAIDARVALELPESGTFIIQLNANGGTSGDYILHLQHAACLNFDEKVGQTILESQVIYHCVPGEQPISVYYALSEAEFTPSLTIYSVPQASSFEFADQLSFGGGTVVSASLYEQAAGVVVLLTGEEARYLVEVNRAPLFTMSVEDSATYTLLVEITQ